MGPGLFALALALASAAAPLEAQSVARLLLSAPEAPSEVVAVEAHRGYAAVPAGTLATLGWTLSPEEGGVIARLDDTTVRLREGSPFFRWDGEVLQLVDPPYRLGSTVWIPLQLFLDFLPARAGDTYALERDPLGLRVLEEGRWRGSPAARAGERSRPDVGGGGTEAPAAAEPAPREPSTVPEPARPEPSTVAPPPDARPDGSPPTRVVVIDPGHGGRDPGAVGPGGTREKDVTLALGLALAEELRRVPGLEVHLTREDDRLVPLWRRGEWATDVKGDRPGIFVSLHANALPSRRSARGFETYFLSEARTEHERRVAALENAAFDLDARGGPSTGDASLDRILTDLSNRDHIRWSSVLAERVQDRLAPVHPGPDRGVKQAPFAVITNALMPAVLVEVGFITNRGEERLVASDSFQRDAARALRRAIVDFFQGYPPGAPALAGRDR